MYFYCMAPEELYTDVLHFFEDIQKYYGSKTEIIEGICTSSGDFSADFSTWNLFEFDLIRSAYRRTGDRFMIEGEGMYYEISATSIVSFLQPGRNKFEFIEQLSENVYRITKLRFHYKY
ncbi:hypothetical protein LZZ90_03185 [Flavobacterium sp. SM15]|uniref:hypothetical protein n=1 Tax=Flavobacterium sp. SM15 TaxID=2908005 RepID=UPI001EDC318F|nr:hypothetical protein [Flavobacterium sp. SM15]MCG2610509.1 hypothetical protein [Flavobacterium sp. SM15]